MKKISKHTGLQAVKWLLLAGFIQAYSEDLEENYGGKQKTKTTQTIIFNLEKEHLKNWG